MASDNYENFYVDSDDIAWNDEDECLEDAHDGQPSEYEEWQDYYGGDDWDHGQYDDCGDY